MVRWASVIREYLVNDGPPAKVHLVWVGDALHGVFSTQGKAISAMVQLNEERKYGDEIIFVETVDVQ